MKSLLSIFAVLSLAFQLSAQSQAEAYIREAQTFLAQKDYKQAQLSLQDAINDLNTLIAGQIAESLPYEINDLRADGDPEVNTAAMGMMGGGVQISRRYTNPSKEENTAEVQIMANSPLMATMGLYLNNPAMMGNGYKSVRVGSRRAILKSEMEDYYPSNGGMTKVRVSELQVPLTQTLITINLRGFASEADELAFASKLDLEKLRVALGE